MALKCIRQHWLQLHFDVSFEINENKLNKDHEMDRAGLDFAWKKNRLIKKCMGSF